jgi:hypothetical protein
MKEGFNPLKRSDSLKMRAFVIAAGIHAKRREIVLEYRTGNRKWEN